MEESKIKIILLFALVFLFTLISCDSTEPPSAETITLRHEDVSCTEAWVTLTTTNLQRPTTVTLKQTNPSGDTKSQILNLNTQDSLLYIDSLLPKQTYKFQSTIHSINLSSNEITVTTMDTTSHNFTFQTWTFGEHSSSVLYDVAIIDENNIIAVGEIYLFDSLGQPDPNVYNVARWNGSDWIIERIAFTGGCHIIYPPIRSIWSFSENDIWFVSGGSLVHYDGVEYYNDCRMNSIITPPLNKIWGTSSSDLYVVGSKGTIIRYNGTLWWRMGTVTELHINDIMGQLSINMNYEILCVASDYSMWSGIKVLKIVNNNIYEINNEGLPQSSMDAVWFVPERKYFVVGDGFYSTNRLGESWVKDLTMPRYSKTGIRGVDFNDIVLSGAYGLLMHYNGFSWKILFSMPHLSGSYGEVQIKGNIIACTGGLNDGQAIITIGKRL